jgi:hypothetical protein
MTDGVEPVVDAGDAGSIEVAVTEDDAELSRTT